MRDALLTWLEEVEPGHIACRAATLEGARQRLLERYPSVTVTEVGNNHIERMEVEVTLPTGKRLWVVPEDDGAKYLDGVIAKWGQ